MLTNIYNIIINKKTRVVILDQRNFPGPSLHLSQHRGEQLVLSGHGAPEAEQVLGQRYKFFYRWFVV
jgi:hypothetical protein